VAAVAEGRLGCGALKPRTGYVPDMSNMFGIALDQSWLQWAAAKGSGRKVPAGSLHDNAVAHAVASWACPKRSSRPSHCSASGASKRSQANLRRQK
jgi:hypothetical protein